MNKKQKQSVIEGGQQLHNDWTAGKLNKRYPPEFLLPKELRPLCKYCSKPREVTCWHEYNEDFSRPKELGKGNMLWWVYKGYGHFCTQRCAVSYANVVADQLQKKTE
jgi:hypothetical protein